MIYKHIIPLLGQKQLNTLTVSDINKFYKKLKTNSRIAKHKINKIEALSYWIER